MGMSGAYTGPDTDEASQYTRTTALVTAGVIAFV